MEFPSQTLTPSTPAIRYDDASTTIYIVGESYPENSFDFYSPLLKWIKQSLTAKKNLILDVNISYMNSSSTKCILDILDLLDEAFSAGIQTSVRWRYDQENPRSLELAEEFKEELKLPFETIPLEI